MFQSLSFDIWVSMICLSLAGAFVWSSASIVRAVMGGRRR